MDDLDRNLLDAWHTVAQRLKQDRVAAARRHARRFNKNLSRPLRPFCLAIRASDTRLDAHATSAILPADPHGEHHYPHEVRVTAEVARSLTSPVNLPFPGTDLTLAAAKLGRHPESLRRWIKLGLLITTHQNARAAGKRGKPVPHVWSPSPLDPASNHAAPPHPVFGSLWQHLADHLPPTLDQHLERHPHFTRYPNSPPRQRGYRFQCPGLFTHTPTHLSLSTPPSNLLLPLGGEGGSPKVSRMRGSQSPPRARIPCNRPVRTLYLPTPTWTIAHALGFPLELDLHNLAGQWIPGLIDPTSNSAPSPPLGGEGGPQGRMRGSPLPAAGAERGFACRHCWNIQRVSLATNSGWNRFITHLSAGLLYGCEVPRPALANPESSRKRPYQPRPRLAADPHPRRTQAAHLFTQGLTHKQIANALSITPAAVATHIKRSHKQHNTHNRQQLKAALSTPTAHTSDA